MPIPDGFAQANFMYTGTAVPHGAEWTLGLDVAPFGGTAADVAAQLEIAYALAGLNANGGTGCNLTNIHVKFGPDATGPSADEAAAHNGSGGAPGPPNTAILVQKNTALGGKAGRGRLYFPSVPEANVDAGGVLGSGVIVAIQADFDTFLDAVRDALIFPVLLHGVSSPISTPTIIESFSVQSVVATQRRRLRP